MDFLFPQDIDAGQPCTGPGQCVDNAKCSAASKTCECDRRYYQEFGVCYPRKLVPDPCSVGQCVKDAECSPSEGVCKCKPGFFVDMGRCSGSKGVACTCV